MTTPLTIEEKLIFRNVKKAAIVWLLLIRLDPQPINETFAAEALAIDKETARKYLRTLNECQIITRLGRFEGYQLTDGGRQLTLPFHLQKLQEANAEIPRSGLFNNIESLNPLKDLTSLSLIKSERGNSAFERGISAFGSNLSTDGDQPVDKTMTIEETDEIVKRLIAEQPEKQAVLDALLYCRIKINWKTLGLLYSETITVDEIKAQYKALQDRGLEKHTGILISNLLTEFKPRGAEFDRETGHPIECHCYKCIGARNKRFIEDISNHEKYSEWDD